MAELLIERNVPITITTMMADLQFSAGRSSSSNYWKKKGHNSCSYATSPRTFPEFYTHSRSGKRLNPWFLIFIRSLLELYFYDSFLTMLKKLPSLVDCFLNSLKYPHIFIYIALAAKSWAEHKCAHNEYMERGSRMSQAVLAHDFFLHCRMCSHKDSGFCIQSQHQTLNTCSNAQTLFKRPDSCLGN